MSPGYADKHLMKRLFPAAMLIVVLSLLLAACGSDPIPTPDLFETTTFTVDGGSVFTLAFDLPAANSIDYRYSSDFELTFRVIGPQDDVLHSAKRSLTGEGSITADELGRYTFIFDNSQCRFTPRIVTFNSKVIAPGDI